MCVGGRTGSVNCLPATVCLSVCLAGSICVYLPIGLSLPPSLSSISHSPTILLSIYSSIRLFPLRCTISYALPTSWFLFITSHSVVCICLCVRARALVRAYVRVCACVCVYVCVCIERENST